MRCTKHNTRRHSRDRSADGIDYNHSSMALVRSAFVAKYLTRFEMTRTVKSGSGNPSMSTNEVGCSGIDARASNNQLVYDTSVVDRQMEHTMMEHERVNDKLVEDKQLVGVRVDYQRVVVGWNQPRQSKLFSSLFFSFFRHQH